MPTDPPVSLPNHASGRARLVGASYRHGGLSHGKKDPPTERLASFVYVNTSVEACTPSRLPTTRARWTCDACPITQFSTAFALGTSEATCWARPRTRPYFDLPRGIRSGACETEPANFRIGVRLAEFGTLRGLFDDVE